MKVVTSPTRTTELIYILPQITTSSRQKVGMRTIMETLPRASGTVTAIGSLYRLTNPRTLAYLITIRQLKGQKRTLQDRHQHTSRMIAMDKHISQTMLMTATRRLSTPV